MAVDRLSVTVPAELGAKLRALAESRGEAVSTIVTEAIEQQIRRAALRELLAADEREFSQGVAARAEAETQDMSRLILDAGAFVAFEKADDRMRERLTVAEEAGLELITSSAVVAQVWRSRRQARIARLLAATYVDAPSEAAARRAGELLAATRTTDVVDAFVIVLARQGDTLVTSDADDLRVLAEAAGIDVQIFEA
jgi:predicted DNA-binding protein/predicted nucleic acid-binding protein